jgi:hypothetical protein
MPIVNIDGSELPDQTFIKVLISGNIIHPHDNLCSPPFHYCDLLVV